MIPLPLAPSLAGDLTGAACAGEWELFDSTDPSDHQLARMICAECPVIDACRQHLRAAQDVGYAGISRNYGPSGTWAGELFGERRQKVAKCGTDQGYYRHRRVLDEPACPDCLTAHRAASRKIIEPGARDRWAAEDAAYTDVEAAQAAAAYRTGDKSDWATIGHRVYQRRSKRRNRKSTAA